MATTLNTNIPTEIGQKLKELLELLNKKSENETILRDFKVQSNYKIDDFNCLITDYNISFSTVLKENKKD